MLLVNAHFGLGEVADMTHRSNNLIPRPEIFLYCFRLCRLTLLLLNQTFILYLYSHISYIFPASERISPYISSSVSSVIRSAASSPSLAAITSAWSAPPRSRATILFCLSVSSSLYADISGIFSVSSFSSSAVLHLFPAVLCILPAVQPYFRKFSPRS